MQASGKLGETGYRFPLPLSSEEEVRESGDTPNGNTEHDLTHLDTPSVGNAEASKRIDFTRFYAKEIKIAQENQSRTELPASDREHSKETVRYRLIAKEEVSQFLLLGSRVFQDIPENELEPILGNLDIWIVEQKPEKAETKHEVITEPWSLFLCQKLISFWPKMISLVKNSTFLLQILRQASLFLQVRQLVEKETARQDPEFLKGFKFEYVFGEPLQDVFQGLDFQTACRMLLACLRLQELRQHSLSESQQGTYKVVFQEPIPELNVVSEVDRVLQEILEVKFEDMWTEGIGKMNLKSSENLCLCGEDVQLTDRIRYEVVKLVEQGQLNKPVAVELDKYVFLIWVLNNLALKETVPLAYCLVGLEQSFVSFYTLALAMEPEEFTVQSATLIDFLITGNMAPLKDQILYEHHSKDQVPVIVAHKRLTQAKKAIEELMDIARLCSHFGVTTFQELEGAVPGAEGTVASRADANPDLLGYLSTNKNELIEIFSDWDHFRSRKLTTERTSGWEHILHSPAVLKILKRYDNSALVSVFRALNAEFVMFVNTLVANPSVYLTSIDAWYRFNQTTFSQNLKEAVFCWQSLRLKHQHLLSSPQVHFKLLQKIKDEESMLKNLVCFLNVDAAWASLQQVTAELHRDPSNAPVPESQRFMLKKALKMDFLRLPKALKKAVKGSRRFQPEYSVPTSNWDFLKKLIQQAHWKVQNGILAWFSVYVAPFPFKIKVLRLLDKLGLSKIASRVAAIQFFAALSKFYRLLQDAQHFYGFDQAYAHREYLDGIPAEIMIDIDTIFGYSEATRSENTTWDSTLFDHLYEWLNRDSKERLFGIDVCRDFEINLAGLSMGLIPTTLQKTFAVVPVQIPVSQSFVRESKGFFWELFSVSGETESPHPAYFVAERSGLVRERAVFLPYSRFIQNYMNFSATGTAKNFRVPLVESPAFAELQVTDPHRYNEIKAKVQQSILEDMDKDSSVSKTVCFAYSGKALLEHFIDVHGDRYVPELSCFVKKESKKLRTVINADLVSFAKQTYLHDWLKLVLPPSVSRKIYSLMTPRERVLGLHRMTTPRISEKWCVPIDLKDFHHHFGQSHYMAVGEVFGYHVAKSVEDPGVQRDLEKIFGHLGEDLSKGEMTFSCVSEEDDLFESQMKANSVGFSIMKSVLDAREDGRNLFRYTLRFRVRNGLMSGWKLTSIFGSLFNLALNKLSETFAIAETGTYATNLNVLGDDTHLNYRHLVSAIGHTGFVNMLGKVAHPDKQLLSTVSSEFLKKRLNSVTKGVGCSVNRMWNSVLYSKTDLKSEMNQTEFVKLNLDIWNLFLSRVECPKLRITAGRKEYLVEFIAKSLRMERYDAEKYLRRLLNTPSFVSGCGSGPLRSLKVDFGCSDQNSDVKLEVEFTRMEVKKNLMLFRLDILPGHFEGVRSEVNGLAGLFNKVSTDFPDIRGRLTAQIVSEITEGIAQYFDDSNLQKESKSQPKKKPSLLQLRPFEEKDTPRTVFREGHSLFCPRRFLDFAVGLVRENLIYGVDFNGLAGELVIHSEAVSKFIFGQLLDRTDPQTDVWPFLNGLLRLKEHKNLSKPYYKFAFKVLGERLFLRVVSSAQFLVPFGRNFKTDETIGFLGLLVSKALYLYLLQLPSFLNNVDKEAFLVKTLVTLDYYVNQHADEIQGRLRKILNELE